MTADPSMTPHSRTGRSVRVLIVDDEIEAAEGVQEILEMEGHTIGLAENLETSMKAAKMMSPDVALVDLRLKDEWGLDVINSLRNEFPDLLFIVQTGNSDSSVVISALREGVYDYLVKPFEPDQLLTVVARAAEKIALQTERTKMMQELARAKDRAEIADRSKSEFLTRMSGEIGEHFNTLVQLAQSMANEQFGPLSNQSYEVCAKGIATGCERMLNNMKQIGELGKLESGAVNVDVQEFSLDAVARATIAEFSDEIARKRLNIDVVGSTELPSLKSDKQHFARILHHILSNAVKYAPEGSFVRLSGDLDTKGDLWIQLADQGPGIAPDRVTQALAPFGRIEGQTSAEPDETSDPFSAGLGLTLANQLVSLLGGKISIASGSGWGTIIQIYFPRERVFEYAMNREAVL